MIFALASLVYVYIFVKFVYFINYSCDNFDLFVLNAEFAKIRFKHFDILY